MRSSRHCPASPPTAAAPTAPSGEEQNERPLRVQSQIQRRSNETDVVDDGDDRSAHVITAKSALGDDVMKNKKN